MAEVGTLNEAALRRFDPYVCKVLDTAQYVALYTFEDTSWKKTNIQGSLFVYSRSGEPLHNIIVLNQLNKNNLVEPITPQLELQFNNPFLLYKNAKGNILGIWFYDKDDCARIASLVRKLMEISPGKVNAQSDTGEKSVDIFKMLTKAQKEFKQEKSKVESPQELVGASKSVADFFAKAGCPDNSLFPRSKSTSESEQSAVPSFQQLKANPAHLVEHIEKQQRSVTPHTVEPQKIRQGSEALRNFIRPRSSEITNSEVEFVSSSTVEEAMQQRQKRDVTPNGLNGFSFLKVNSPKETPSSSSKQQKEERKPDLMPPAMFTPKSENSAVFEPLTRNQLVQAFEYLFHNDANFMTMVHEAYVKSLTNKIL